MAKNKEKVIKKIFHSFTHPPTHGKHPPTLAKTILIFLYNISKILIGYINIFLKFLKALI